MDVRYLEKGAIQDLPISVIYRRYATVDRSRVKDYLGGLAGKITTNKLPSGLETATMTKVLAQYIA